MFIVCSPCNFAASTFFPNSRINPLPPYRLIVPLQLCSCLRIFLAPSYHFLVCPYFLGTSTLYADLFDSSNSPEIVIHDFPWNSIKNRYTMSDSQFSSALHVGFAHNTLNLIKFLNKIFINLHR